MLTKFIFLQNDGFTTVVILSAGKKKKRCFSNSTVLATVKKKKFVVIGEKMKGMMKTNVSSSCLRICFLVHGTSDWTNTMNIIVTIKISKENWKLKH